MLTKHYAVVANRVGFDTKRRPKWHRTKAGSIEAVHDVLKNELAAEVMKRLRIQLCCSPGRLIHHALKLPARVIRKFAELAK